MFSIQEPLKDMGRDAVEVGNTEVVGLNLFVLFSLCFSLTVLSPVSTNSGFSGICIYQYVCRYTA